MDRIRSPVARCDVEGFKERKGYEIYKGRFGMGFGSLDWVGMVIYKVISYQVDLAGNA